MNKGRSEAAMVIYNEQPLIISGYASDNFGEIFKNGKWEKTSPIPNQRSAFCHHSALTVNNKVYTFGGTYDDYANYPVGDSYIYDSINWTKSEGLLKTKHFIRSIKMGNQIYHVGGYSAQDSSYYGLIENWEIENGSFKKETADFGYATKYLWNPEVIQVENDFC